MPDDFSCAHLDREPELVLWAGRIREHPGRGLTVFVLANNRFQGHGPATARGLLAELAGVASDP
jgi:uncharacterized protein YecE (DUF72 family)